MTTSRPARRGSTADGRSETDFHSVYNVQVAPRNPQNMTCFVRWWWALVRLTASWSSSAIAPRSHLCGLTLIRRQCRFVCDTFLIDWALVPITTTERESAAEPADITTKAAVFQEHTLFPVPSLLPSSHEWQLLHFHLCCSAG
jgi:hypothetical protein